MLTTFTLLVAVGAGFRLALSTLLRRRYNLALDIPQGLVVLLILLACLPSWASPVSLPLPVGLLFGAVLPDLFVRRT